MPLRDDGRASLQLKNKRLTRLRALARKRVSLEKNWIRLTRLLNTLSLSLALRASFEHKNNHQDDESDESHENNGLDRYHEKADKRDKLPEQHYDERDNRQDSAPPSGRFKK